MTTYNSLRKRDLIANLKARDRTIARERKMTCKAFASQRERMEKLTNPAGIGNLLRLVVQLFKGGKKEQVIAALSGFFSLNSRDAKHVVSMLYNRLEPLPDMVVHSDERDAIRKEHSRLNQRIARQDAQIERLVMERTRARGETQTIAKLVSTYRLVLADVLGDPEVVVAPSLAMTPQEAVATMVENPDNISGVFSDEALKKPTAYDEISE
jgi:DNA gyrase/topoisomerase IV subunit A